MGLMRGKGRTKVGIGGSVMRRARKRVKGANAPKLRRSAPIRCEIMAWLLARADGSSLPPERRQFMAREVLVERPRGLRDRASAHRAVRRSPPHRAAARSPSISRPHRTRPAPRRRRWRAGPAARTSIAASKRDAASRAQSARSMPFGIGEHVLALDHRRGAAEPIGGAGEQLDLRGQADLVQRESPRACAHRTPAPPRARGSGTR